MVGWDEGACSRAEGMQCQSWVPALLKAKPGLTLINYPLSYSHGRMPAVSAPTQLLKTRQWKYNWSDRSGLSPALRGHIWSDDYHTMRPACLLIHTPPPSPPAGALLVSLAVVVVVGGGGREDWKWEVCVSAVGRGAAVPQKTVRPSMWGVSFCCVSFSLAAQCRYK